MLPVQLQFVYEDSEGGDAAVLTALGFMDSGIAAESRAAAWMASYGGAVVNINYILQKYYPMG